MEDRPRTTPYPLRMPDDLRYKLEIAAKEGNRSLHAEIVARLEGSLNGFIDRDLTVRMLGDEVNRLTEELRSIRGTGNELMAKVSSTVEEQVRQVMETTGFSFEEALLLVVTRGAVLETAAPTIVIQIAKGTPLDEVKALVRVVAEQAPPDANLIYEQKAISKTKRLTSQRDTAALVAKLEHRNR